MKYCWNIANTKSTCWYWNYEGAAKAKAIDSTETNRKPNPKNPNWFVCAAVRSQWLSLDERTHAILHSHVSLHKLEQKLSVLKTRCSYESNEWMNVTKMSTRQYTKVKTAPPSWYIRQRDELLWLKSTLNTHAKSQIKLLQNNHNLLLKKLLPLNNFVLIRKTLRARVRSYAFWWRRRWWWWGCGRPTAINPFLMHAICLFCSSTEPVSDLLAFSSEIWAQISDTSFSQAIHTQNVIQTHIQTDRHHRYRHRRISLKLMQTMRSHGDNATSPAIIIVVSLLLLLSSSSSSLLTPPSPPPPPPPPSLSSSSSSSTS